MGRRADFKLKEKKGPGKKTKKQKDPIFISKEFQPDLKKDRGLSSHQKKRAKIRLDKRKAFEEMKANRKQKKDEAKKKKEDEEAENDEGIEAESEDSDAASDNAEVDDQLVEAEDEEGEVEDEEGEAEDEEGGRCRAKEEQEDVELILLLSRLHELFCGDQRVPHPMEEDGVSHRKSRARAPFLDGEQVHRAAVVVQKTEARPRDARFSVVACELAPSATAVRAKKIVGKQTCKRYYSPSVNHLDSSSARVPTSVRPYSAHQVWTNGSTPICV